MKISKLLDRKYFKLGYEVRTELWTHDNNSTKMKAAYNPSGQYIGNLRDVQFFIKKKGIRIFELAKSTNLVCSIGFNPEKQIWYGWSHRAIVGFRIGNKLFEENFGNDKTPFINHGKITIKTLAQAKQAAINFANYIS